MVRPRWFMLAVAALAVGCHGNGAHNNGDDGGGADPDGRPGDPDAGDSPDADLGVDANVPIDAAPAPDAEPPTYPYMDLDVGCAPIFAQSIVPEYDLTIHEDDWEAMENEFLHPQFDSAGQIIDPPYHPVQLHVVEGSHEYDPPNVMIRIAGNTSWLQAIMFDANPKMQFTIAFNKIDSDGRFELQRKIKLDMPRSDWTFLQQRVAQAWMRGRAGIPAQCANNARVVINGSLYGLYTNLESQDKSWLKRIYGGDLDDGDLWKGARIITTNEDTFSWAHLSAFWHVTDLSGLDGVADVDTSMREWVSETIVGDTDGYNQGRPNFFLYDDPENGKFVWLENDLDTTFDEAYLPADSTPVFKPEPPAEARRENDWKHYLITMNDPSGVSRYVAAMNEQLPKMDAAEVQQWIDDWSAQIAQAAADDPMKPFTNQDHDWGVTEMREYVAARASYLQTWLACWSGGGADADGDGFDMCHDCNDADAAQSPGALEICDSVDNNCNGYVDDVAGGTCTMSPQVRPTWE